MTRAGMHTSTVLILSILFVSGEACAVYDADGNSIRAGTHFMGIVSRNARIGALLPGEIRLKDLRPKEMRGGNCSASLTMVSLGDSLRFEVHEEFAKTDFAVMNCTFAVALDGEAGCPATISLSYVINDYDLHAPVFEKNNYSFRWTFPLAVGAKLHDGEIVVTDPDFSSRRIDLKVQGSADGIEVVRIGSANGKTSRFELRTTKILRLQEDLDLTLIATVEPGELSSKAHLKLQMNENFGIPRPAFEKSFYDVILRTSDLDADKDVYPAGTIKLKDYYPRLNVSLRPLEEYDLHFRAINLESSRTVHIRLLETPNTNFSSHEIVLNLTARATDVVGRESEGSALLFIRLVEDSQYPLSNMQVRFEPNNEENLKTTVIVLSVMIVVLLLLIFFGYFKYVCVKKRQSEPPLCAKCSLPPQCMKCSAPSMKTRRPTPQKISEYPYPLDKLQPPLETLPESDVEEDDDGSGQPTRIKQLQVAKETSPKASTTRVKTRKRSMTFIESDEESRQNRESLEVAFVVEKERKVSRGSQCSVEEERRRRTSSTKIYRCLT